MPSEDERFETVRVLHRIFEFLASGGLSLVWTLVNEEPLTITPSINCLDCGCHAFITDGRWTGPEPPTPSQETT